ncbi:hypothetical protein [Kineococcus indalonis]|uniref:hypothetical protein n=1 Tax=Kineococcus indalonis TaxID=2696566 RepID=UPI00141235CF|nr:hypothetical protein [Kineococcus indalonis]NAZ88524.1 hypothetical protein [Kineococcus indalonis]
MSTPRPRDPQQRSRGLRAPRYRAAAAFAVLAAGASAAVATAGPPARRVGCGEVLTADVRLAADLECSGAVGLVVRADGVDVDLDGHRVTGPRLTADLPSDSYGISVEAHDVTVRDGRVAGWDVGVRVGVEERWSPREPGTAERRGAPGSALLRDLRLELDGTGALTGSEGTVLLTGSVLRGNNTGAVAAGRLVVTRTSVEGNFAGLTVESGGTAPSLALRSSRLQHNDIALLCRRPGLVVQGSAFSTNDTALLADGCAPWTVRDSRFEGNGRHLWLDGSGPATVACTVFTGSAGPGPGPTGAREADGVRVRPCPPRLPGAPGAGAGEGAPPPVRFTPAP